MNRTVYFNSPFLLGFEHLERLLERTAKSAGDGYPPYNIEQSSEDALRITLAVAGFGKDELNVTVEGRQLVIRGKQGEPNGKTFPSPRHRGTSVSARLRTCRRDRSHRRGVGTWVAYDRARPAQSR
ncbi:MAG: Hsp20 family protein [Rhizomicrobium sp.]